MKTCPVCQSKTFDDAAVCYGCMHRYDEAGREDKGKLNASGVEVAPQSEAHPCADRLSPIQLQGQGGVLEREALRMRAAPSPAFFIKMTPAFGEMGQVTWACAVELAT